MMSNNKILTVSYGTFSCTLEGFEDSFGTMKAIAEYFRDLAADDRYFGAEPPQPDAEMLARIAQKEVSRRVEAREQDGTIVLSALDAGAAAVPAVTSEGATEVPVADLADAQPDAVVEAEPPAVDPVEDTAEVVATAPVAPEAFDADDAGIKIADVEVSEPETVEEAAVEVKAPVVIEDVPEPAAEVDAADEDAEDTKEAIAAEAEAEETDEALDIVPGQPDEEVEAFFADSPAAETVEDDDNVPEAAPVLATATGSVAQDSIAAKLQRIRAVVAQQEESEDTDSYLEDQHAETKTPVRPADMQDEISDEDAADAVADARAELEDALEADAPADEAADVSGILSRIEKAQQDTLIAEDDEAEGDVIGAADNLFDEAEEDAQADVQDAVAAAMSDHTEDEAEADEPVAEKPVEDGAAPVAEAPAARQPRVIKVKRADLEAAIDKGDLEEYEDDAEAAEDTSQAEAPRGLDDLAPARKATTALSPEDEAELARELAALREDIAANGKDTADASGEDAVAEKPRGDRAARLPRIDETNDGDMNRLMAETDHQMDEPESATRRDAFAHLRAAVAARKADTSLNAPDSGKADGDYRNDLAEVVRPRRPQTAASRAERPAEDGPAPLKLVAEQRVDVAPQSAASGPVRPRRVATLAETGAGSADEGSFADFANDMGAATLPELLEAAASYMSFVEGREQFSRPQLMTKVRQAGGEDGFSREEGLRSFGQLLRAGKIEKVKGGRFTVSDDIGYRPDHRAAG